MDFLHELFNNYRMFLSLNALQEVLTNPASWGVISSLILLEGLLSADNALVLAVVVKHLPKEKRKKALFYGIFGAYFFRIIAIGIGVTLVKIAWIKIVCGHYLLWIVFQNFVKKSEDESETKSKKMGFWQTVLTVELMDITFSFDSIMAAFGVSNQEWVLFAGGILGILMMRGVAQIFLTLIEKVPELETTAFILIAIIGVKMIVSAFNIQVEETIFFTILVTMFLGTFIVHFFRKTSRNRIIR